MTRRPKWRALKKHRNYTVDEAARTLGVCKATMRRWIKAGHVPALDDSKPMLILGSALIAYGKARRKPRFRCELDQAFCMSCRVPKNAALGRMTIVSATPASANVRMQCPTCSTAMHKRFAWRKLPLIAPFAQLSAPQALRHLIETAQPSLNVHFEKDE